jgi:uncharacterized protein
MKIIVLSDTHIHGEMPEELLGIVKDADIVVHAGDFITRQAYDSLKVACKKLVAVHGNSDEEDLKAALPESETFEAGGVKFGVVHSGRFGTDTMNMRYLALEMGVKVLIFGHLHRPIIEQSDVLLVCPGSPTQPRMADPTMVSLDVMDGKVTGNIVKIQSGDLCGYIKFMRSL